MLWFKKNKQKSWEHGRTAVRRDSKIRKDTMTMYRIFLRTGKSKRRAYEDAVAIHGKGYYAP